MSAVQSILRFSHWRLLFGLTLGSVATLLAFRFLSLSFLGFAWLERGGSIALGLGVIAIIWRMSRLKYSLPIVMVLASAFLFLLVPTYLAYTHDLNNPVVFARLEDRFHPAGEKVKVESFDAISGEEWVPINLFIMKSSHTHPRTAVATWREDWTASCAAALVEAKKLKLDGNSLLLCLNASRRYQAQEDPEKAIIPIAAFSTRDAGVPVWMIVCAWESYAFLQGSEKLGHVRTWELDARTGKKLNFFTCM